MKKYKIAIVENDEDEQYFIKEGFNVPDLFDIQVIARNGNELFAWLESRADELPDLVLSDLNMPGKNGYDIISEMKATPMYSSIPVYIMSTSATSSIIDKCMQLGATGYRIKPDTFIEYEPFAKNLYDLMQGDGRVEVV